MAEKQYQTAITHYLRCAELFIRDKKIKPLALYKAAQAYENYGEKDKATLFRQQLQREFPGWKPTEYPEASKAVFVHPEKTKKETLHSGNSRPHTTEHQQWEGKNGSTFTARVTGTSPVEVFFATPEGLEFAYQIEDLSESSQQQLQQLSP